MRRVSRGVAVDLDYVGRSAKGQMKQAGRSGARYAFIVGEQELLDALVTVRDLASGEEDTVPRTEAVARAAQGVANTRGAKDQQ